MSTDTRDEALRAARAAYEDSGNMVSAVKAYRNVSGQPLRESLNACKVARVRDGWNGPERGDEELTQALQVLIGAELVQLVDRASVELGIGRRFVWAEIAFVSTRNARGETP